MKELFHRGWYGGAFALLWEPRDLWVGVYWTTTIEPPYWNLILYICVVPCLPIQLTLARPILSLPDTEDK